MGGLRWFILAHLGAFGCMPVWSPLPGGERVRVRGERVWRRLVPRVEGSGIGGTRGFASTRSPLTPALSLPGRGRMSLYFRTRCSSSYAGAEVAPSISSVALRDSDVGSAAREAEPSSSRRKRRGRTSICCRGGLLARHHACAARDLEMEVFPPRQVGGDQAEGVGASAGEVEFEQGHLDAGGDGFDRDLERHGRKMP